MVTSFGKFIDGGGHHPLPTRLLGSLDSPSKRPLAPWGQALTE